MLFDEVVRAGTFSAAGERLGLTPSAVSRAITRLEDKVGVQLLRRSTRLLALTPEGEILLDGAPAVLAALAALEGEIAEQRHIVKGNLSVSIGTALAESLVLPALPRFMARHPEVTLDLNVTDRRVSLLRERIDLAVRTGPLADASLVAKRIATGRRIICASRDYLDRFGRPAVPEDLQTHRCLCMSGHDDLEIWPFLQDGQVTRVRVVPAMRSDSARALSRMAVAGLGIVRLADFVVGEAVANGTLIPLFDTVHHVEEFPIWAIFAPAERVPLRLRAFLDFLTEDVFGPQGTDPKR